MEVGEFWIIFRFSFKKLTSNNFKLCSEFPACFEELSENSDCRAIVLSGIGKGFCAGDYFENGYKL